MTVEGWIALVSLAVAVLAAGYPILRSRRAAKEAEERSRRADLKVRLERDPGRIVVRNDGEGVAEDVRLVVARDEGPSPIERDARRKLPLARLNPGEECSFSALVAWEIETEFNCVITWRDSGGEDRREELSLDV